MAIKLNGTLISINRLNSSNITLENLNGVKVFPNINHVWVYLYETSSQPTVDLPFVEDSGTPDLWLGRIISTYPPNNYSIGTTGCVWDGYGNLYRIYQIQEG